MLLGLLINLLVQFQIILCKSFIVCNTRFRIIFIAVQGHSFRFYGIHGIDKNGYEYNDNSNYGIQINRNSKKDET